MKREDIDIDNIRNKLSQELANVSKDLSNIGRKNPDNKADWEAVPAKTNVESADPSDLAESMEDYESNMAILKELEIRYNDIKDALDKIDKGNYGFCEVSGEPIEKDRLEANLSSRTCKAHMGS